MTTRAPGQRDDDEPRLAPVAYLPGARRGDEQGVDEYDPEEFAPDGYGTDEYGTDESQSDYEAEERRAENISMHALTRRGQSRAEIGELLLRRDINVCVVESELDRLESVGLIDDKALALELVDRLRTRKKLGPSALRNELMRRKLDREVIDEALAEAELDDAADDLVVELARDRARRLGGLDRSTAERRLVDFLARKGHTGSTARDAARQALDESDSGGGVVHRVQFR
ncbi:MAG: regulatory protein RecX [Microcella sp.]|uniref:regulatory protein RecX n=1 Tax=Microcella sp. TaxID=1913979 RepID=UPI0024CBB2DB|nr:regulatory protein RecX [Microcella sp.]UYN84531.1 MAG: regulatory protein RecX [Microcella sp.]